MSKDNFEGGARSAVGQGESFIGAATEDKASEVRGQHGEAAGRARSQRGRVQYVAEEMAHSGSISDLSRLCARTSQG